MSAKSLGHVDSGPNRYEVFDDRSWRVTADGREFPTTAAALEALYRDAFRSPSAGFWGPAVLEDLAKRLGGWAVYETPAAPPGTVY